MLFFIGSLALLRWRYFDMNGVPPMLRTASTRAAFRTRMSRAVIFRVCSETNQAGRQRPWASSPSVRLDCVWKSSPMWHLPACQSGLAATGRSCLCDQTRRSSSEITLESLCTPPLPTWESGQVYAGSSLVSAQAWPLAASCTSPSMQRQHPGEQRNAVHVQSCGVRCYSSAGSSLGNH